MFVDIEDTRQVWFNAQSFEVDHNYKLIGMLLGLAVYNNVILDIRFPTVSTFSSLINIETLLYTLQNLHALSKNLMYIKDLSGWEIFLLSKNVCWLIKYVDFSELLHDFCRLLDF